MFFPAIGCGVQAAVRRSEQIFPLRIEHQLMHIIVQISAGIDGTPGGCRSDKPVDLITGTQRKSVPDPPDVLPEQSAREAGCAIAQQGEGTTFVKRPEDLIGPQESLTTSRSTIPERPTPTDNSILETVFAAGRPL